MAERKNRIISALNARRRQVRRIARARREEMARARKEFAEAGPAAPREQEPGEQAGS